MRWVLVGCCLTFCFNIARAQLRTTKKVISLMGSRFEFVAVHTNSIASEDAIAHSIAEVKRIENLISSWSHDSETSKINQKAGLQPVSVSEELFNLIERSIKVSVLTHGAFDISFASLEPVWKFDGSTVQEIDSNLVAQSISKIQYQNIILERSALTVLLKEKGMKIGFGAIGKGYAANRAKLIMQKHGIENGMVNAGGDLVSWGRQADSSPWQSGIADPSKKKGFLAWLSISDLSIVTSGNYEKFVIYQGRKYGHIIDPHTGYPVEGIKSVTLVSPDAELSDALSTSVFVMGVKKGMELVNRLKNVECLIIDDNDKLWTSDNLKLNYY